MNNVGVMLPLFEVDVLTRNGSHHVRCNQVILSLGDYMNVQCHACIGGKSIGEDIRRLDYGVQVVSGTPGRVFDMIRRRNLKTKNLKMLVIDEADEMLNKGFKDQIYDIYRSVHDASSTFRPWLVV